MANAIFRTNAIRTENAANFVMRWRELNPATDNRLYCLIGRETDPEGHDPGEGQWPIESLPPAPTDTVAGDLTFWSMLIGGQKVNANDICLVVPKYSGTYWNEGAVKSVSDFDIYDVNDAALGTKNFYCQNHVNEVFLCVKKGRNLADTEDVDPTVQPRFAEIYANPATRPSIKVDGSDVGEHYVLGDGMQSVLELSDGWVWKYMYTIHPNFISSGLVAQQNWLPVNFAQNTTQESDDNDPASQSQDNIETSNAGVFGQSYKILGGRYVLVRCGLTSGEADGSTEVLPSGLNYRQVALVVNPRSIAGSRATFTVGYQPCSVSETGLSGNRQFQINSGDLIYIENRPPIFRVEDQVEEIRAVMSF